MSSIAIIHGTFLVMFYIVAVETVESEQISGNADGKGTYNKQIRLITGLSFPPVYHAAAVIRIPSAGIVEPFEAWYAGKFNKSRIDYYGGTVKTFQRADVGRYGTLFEVIPKYDYRHDSHYRGCWKKKGKEKKKIEPQNVLPKNVYWPFKMNLTQYKFQGIVKLNGTSCTKWTATTEVLNRTDTYTFHATDEENPKPVRFEMQGYDILLTSYYDHYIIDYTRFEKWNYDSQMFNIPQVAKRDGWCQKVPKDAGEAGYRSINPIQEFLDKEDYDAFETKFKHFKNKFGKDYQHETEYRKRMHIVRHNMRYIHSMNRQQLGFKLDINHFTDLTDGEFDNHRGMSYDNEKETEAFEKGIPILDENFNPSKVSRLLNVNGNLSKSDAESFIGKEKKGDFEMAKFNEKGAQNLEVISKKYEIPGTGKVENKKDPEANIDTGNMQVTNLGTGPRNVERRHNVEKNGIEKDFEDLRYFEKQLDDLSNILNDRSDERNMNGLLASRDQRGRKALTDSTNRLSTEKDALSFPAKGLSFSSKRDGLTERNHKYYVNSEGIWPDQERVNVSLFEPYLNTKNQPSLMKQYILSKSENKRTKNVTAISRENETLTSVKERENSGHNKSDGKGKPSEHASHEDNKKAKDEEISIMKDEPYLESKANRTSVETITKKDGKTKFAFAGQTQTRLHKKTHIKEVMNSATKRAKHRRKYRKETGRIMIEPIRNEEISDILGDKKTVQKLMESNRSENIYEPAMKIQKLTSELISEPDALTVEKFATTKRENIDNDKYTDFRKLWQKPEEYKMTPFFEFGVDEYIPGSDEIETIEEQFVMEDDSRFPKEFFNSIRKGKMKKSKKKKKKEKKTRIPEELDWREYGAVAPIQSQGICGSCWTFSTTAAVESAHFIKTGEQLKLSEQQLLDCTWYVPHSKEGNHGCMGGWTWKSFAYIKQFGLATSKTYGKYQGMESSCKTQNYTVGAKIDSFMKVKSNSAKALMKAIANYGPATASINTEAKTLKFYKNGVYNDKICNGATDHSVLIVGYGKEKGKLYWIVRNSWGTSWGDHGYVKIQSGRCGLLKKPWVVINRKKNSLPWQHDDKINFVNI